MMVEAVRGALGIMVWLTFGGLLLFAVLFALYLIGRILKSLFSKEERFSLAKEIEEFKKRKRAGREDLSREELVRSYILSAVNAADMETVEKVVREVKREIKRRKEEEDRWRDEWYRDISQDTEEFGIWYTTINAWNKD